MNVLIVSQCSKNALKQTRQIMDQFAERRGDRVWQTAITWQGLDTLRRLLKKTARKNTAIACHWIRGKDNTELLWIVGSAAAFNNAGATPTNTTEKNILRAIDENDWHNLVAIRLLADLAALFHDLGKANETFQRKLAPKAHKKAFPDPLRHEWVSLRLFEAFVAGSTDRAWLEQLATLPDSPESFLVDRLVNRDGVMERPPSPFRTMPDLARAVGWLIVAHHRIPSPISRDGRAPTDDDLNHQPDNIYASWCGARLAPTIPKPKERKEWEQTLAGCWRFDHGLSIASPAWLKRARRIARRALDTPEFVETNWLDNPHALHLARMALVLADHHYSSLQDPGQRVSGESGHPLYANTRKDHMQGVRCYNQRLDEHLVGVEMAASHIVQALPRLERQLPRIARHRGFKQRSHDSQFKWQDRAYDLAASLRDATAEQGFFGVNLASTGCGKTLANGRIMYALANHQKGARFTLALGLRVLTMQTGDAYRHRLGLGPDDLAVLVGGAPSRELYDFHHKKEQEDSAAAEAAGSESAHYALLPEHGSVHYEGSLEPGPLAQWLAGNHPAQKLLNCPVLACTIDHLIPATEGLRGGRQIAPMLRLMSADLVLDEPDDFDLDDLPALTRLMHWSGMLGCRVLLSSATMPPALVQALFEAYMAGRANFQQNRGIPGAPVNVCCAWFDEFSCQAASHADSQSFMDDHGRFVDNRLQSLTKRYEIRRRAKIVPIAPAPDGQGLAERFASTIHESALHLHRLHHSIDPVTGKRVSFGLVRMANIDPLVEVTVALAKLPPPAGVRLHLCCYHSQHPLLVRSEMERRLDRLLDRQQEDRIFSLPELRAILDSQSEADHLFVVMATPVAEVGRDHDYDWAVVEPSSMRSIIQIAGRVRRHRPGICHEPNIHLLETNLKTLRDGNAKPTFCRPGFEDKQFSLASHNLTDLLTSEQYADVSAAPRIAQRPNPDPRNNLADLEHEHLRATLLYDPESEKRKSPASLWWTTRAHLSGWLQRTTPFRDNGGRFSETFAMLPDDDDEPTFFRLEQDGQETKQQSRFSEMELTLAPGVSLWGDSDYLTLVEQLAAERDMEPRACARRYGTVALDSYSGDASQCWRYHPALGFCRK